MGGWGGGGGGGRRGGICTWQPCTNSDMFSLLATT